MTCTIPSLINSFLPVKSLPPIKRRRLQEELHPTGCARSEGYYKIDARDKTRYLPHLRRSKGNQTNQKEV